MAKSFRLSLDPVKGFLSGLEGVVIGNLVALHARRGADNAYIVEFHHPAVAVADSLSLNVKASVLFNVHDLSPPETQSTCLAGHCSCEQARGVVFNFPPTQGTGAWSVVRKFFDLADVFLSSERPGVQ